MRRNRARESLLALALLAPSLAVFGVFIFYPLVRTAWLGLHRNDFFGGNRTYVGWSQYGDVAGSDVFRDSLGTTVVFALLTVPVGLVLGLGLAVLADKKLRGIGVFRTLFASTVATSVAVASLMFLVLFNPSIGVLTELLPFDVLKNPGLLNDPDTALVAVAVTTVWQNLGFTFVVISASSTTPADLPSRFGRSVVRAFKNSEGLSLPSRFSSALSNAARSCSPLAVNSCGLR